MLSHTCVEVEFGNKYEQVAWQCVDKSCDTVLDLLREPKRDPSWHVLKFVTESMFISELTIEIGII